MKKKQTKYFISLSVHILLVCGILATILLPILLYLTYIDVPISRFSYILLTFFLYLMYTLFLTGIGLFIYDILKTKMGTRLMGDDK